MRISDWSSDVCSSDLGIDGEESSIEIAVGHARHVDLDKISGEFVAVGEAPAGASEMHRRVEMGVEGKHRRMRILDGFRHGRTGTAGEHQGQEHGFLHDTPSIACEAAHLPASTGLNSRS